MVLGGASKAGNVAKTETIEPTCCGMPIRSKSGGNRSAVDQQTHCPILTSIPVDADSPEVEFAGVKFKVCCTGCLKRWKAEPEAYLIASNLPQLKGRELPARRIDQVFCPVYRDRVVSSKDPSAQYRGVTVFFFNETARKKFLANPQRYADPIIVPQLRNAE